jgi:hypothetical protein
MFSKFEINSIGRTRTEQQLLATRYSIFFLLSASTLDSASDPASAFFRAVAVSGGGGCFVICDLPCPNSHGCFYSAPITFLCLCSPEPLQKSTDATVED